MGMGIEMPSPRQPCFWLYAAYVADNAQTREMWTKNDSNDVWLFHAQMTKISREQLFVRDYFAHLYN